MSGEQMSLENKCPENKCHWRTNVTGEQMSGEQMSLENKCLQQKENKCRRTNVRERMSLENKQPGLVQPNFAFRNFALRGEFAKAMLDMQPTPKTQQHSFKTKLKHCTNRMFASGQISLFEILLFVVSLLKLCQMSDIEIKSIALRQNLNTV